MLCDANGMPLRFLLSGGQASDIAYAQPLLDEACISSLRGRPRKRCRWLLADMGYDAEALRRDCDRYRMQPVVPLRSMKRKSKPGLPRLFDRPKYRQRSVIERMFGWLKENRRIVTRFDKLAKSFEAMVLLACAKRCKALLFVQSLDGGNPKHGVKRPRIESDEGKTPVLGDDQAKLLLTARRLDVEGDPRPCRFGGAAVPRPSPRGSRPADDLRPSRASWH